MYKDFHILETASFVQQKYNVNHEKSLILIKSCHCLHKLLCFFYMLPVHISSLMLLKKLVNYYDKNINHAINVSLLYNLLS